MKYAGDFYGYLEKEKRCSDPTLAAYVSDTEDFCRFLEKRGKELDSAGKADIVSYLMELKSEGKSASTVNRRLSSLRCCFRFLKSSGKLSSDPTEGIKSPKIQKDAVKYLSQEEVEKLLAAPDDSDKGLRDRALMELIYATGIRASEISVANVEDINFKIGFIFIKGEKRIRMVPIGRPARKALEEYTAGPRKRLIGSGEDGGALFVNFLGRRISRQGVWKLIKFYGEKAGLGSAVNPKLIRNSFAAHMVKNGADIRALQEILGCEDPETAKALLDLRKNRIMDVYDKAFPRA